jgi:hypothetical protein
MILAGDRNKKESVASKRPFVVVDLSCPFWSKIAAAAIEQKVLASGNLGFIAHVHVSVGRGEYEYCYSCIVVVAVGLGSATRCCHLDLLQIETQPLLVQGMSRRARRRRKRNIVHGGGG